MPCDSRAAKAVALLALGLAAAASAEPRPPDTYRFQSPNGFSWGDLSLLPDYCYDAQGVLYGFNESPRTAQWTALMGRDFYHIHHYCQALRDFNLLKAAGLSKSQRDVILSDLDRNMKYIMQECQPANPLYPEFLLRFGDFHVLRQDFAAAGEYFSQARKMKPDYWPAYTHWIEVLLTLKLRGEAKALAAEGLRHAPDAEPLRVAYRQLGGDPATVRRPVAEPAASAPVQAAAPAASGVIP